MHCLYCSAVDMENFFQLVCRIHMLVRKVFLYFILFSCLSLVFLFEHTRRPGRSRVGSKYDSAQFCIEVKCVSCLAHVSMKAGGNA